MRRVGAALVALLVVTLIGPPAGAATGTGSFLIANPSLAWACEPHAIYLDTATATAAQLEVARAAVATFARSSARPWPLTTDPAAPVRIRWTDDPAIDEGAITILGADASHYLGVDVEVSRTVPARWLRSVLLHELGHVAGLDHVEDQRQTMGLYPSQPHDRYEVGDLVGLAVLAQLACR